VTVSIDKEGKLGVGLGGLSIANLEKLGYYKVK
jgi:regulator of sigma E protease